MLGFEHSKKLYKVHINSHYLLSSSQEVWTPKDLVLYSRGLKANQE